MSPDPAINPDPVTQNYSNLLTPLNASASTSDFDPTETRAPASPQSAIRDPQSEIPGSDPLSDRQLAAMDLMLTGYTDTAISKELNLSRKTLYNWRTHDPAFRAELLRRREALFGQSTDRFRILLDRAMDTLEKQVKDNYNPTSHRAARTLLIVSRIGHHLAPKIPDTPALHLLHQNP